MVIVVCACSAEPAEYADRADDPRAEVLAPAVEPLGDARIIAQGVPAPSQQGGQEYDHPAAALSVLDLYAAVLSAWHGAHPEPSAQSLTVPGSPAREHVGELVEAVRASSQRPQGTFVLRGFEVGGFSADMLQVDFCLDQSETSLPGGEAGEVADLARGAPGGSTAAVLWTGVGMQRSDEGQWRAFDISHREVGGDPEHACAEPS